MYPPGSKMHSVPGYLSDSDKRLVARDAYPFVKNVKIKITWNSRYASDPDFPVIGKTTGDSMRNAYLFVDGLTRDNYKGFVVTYVWITSKS